jgi:hypothetical protein
MGLMRLNKSLRCSVAMDRGRALSRLFSEQQEGRSVEDHLLSPNLEGEDCVFINLGIHLGLIHISARCLLIVYRVVPLHPRVGQCVNHLPHTSRYLLPPFSFLFRLLTVCASLFALLLYL